MGGAVCLPKGEKINEIPTLDGTVFGAGKAGITDYDGRHRALAAKETPFAGRWTIAGSPTITRASADAL